MLKSAPGPVTLIGAVFGSCFPSGEFESLFAVKERDRTEAEIRPASQGAGPFPARRGRRKRDVLQRS